MSGWVSKRFRLKSAPNSKELLMQIKRPKTTKFVDSKNSNVIIVLNYG